MGRNQKNAFVPLHVPTNDACSGG